jgi:hypothetical protein
MVLDFVASDDFVVFAPASTIDLAYLCTLCVIAY